jgi:Asp-tRNA(Asn)/Glu-tRNA(Gln) amidotransferase A subunit family amidase
LIEIDYLGLRSTVGGLGSFTAMSMAAAQLNAESEPPDSVAKWLAANMPGITVEQFNGVPISTQARQFGQYPRLSEEEQTRLLAVSAQKYQEIFRSNNVVAIAAPTVPVLPQRFTPTGSTDFETIEIKGKTIDRGSVIIAQSIIAPRYGAPGLSVPAGLSEGLPVGLEFDGMPGRDSEILGLGIAVENVLGPLPAPRASHRKINPPLNGSFGSK